MGTWDTGLLDNDTALDGLGDLTHGITEDIESLGAAKPTAVRSARLGAAVGVLLQLSSYELGLDSPSGPKIAAAVESHGAALTSLPPAARKVLREVAAGKGKALAERPARMSAAQIALLNACAKKPYFGKREPSLFASTAAQAYVQEVARRCMDAVAEDFEDEENISDLCREGMGLGTLAALMVLEPCRVPPAKLERWRRLAKKGLAELEADPDDELDFHRKYYENLDAVFAVLIRRFS
jgi:hypothetical protein